MSNFCLHVLERADTTFDGISNAALTNFHFATCYPGTHTGIYQILLSSPIQSSKSLITKGSLFFSFSSQISKLRMTIQLDCLHNSALHIFLRFMFSYLKSILLESLRLSFSHCVNHTQFAPKKQTMEVGICGFAIVE
jgi:hypothetical protein